MSKQQLPVIMYKGRSLGIVVLVASQIIIGAIHAFFGVLLFTFENISLLPITAVYDVYTFIFGLSALIFAVFIWRGKKIGWVGTVAISLFVIAADSLTLLDLPSIPGIPKFAGLTEIAYSVLIVAYLCGSQVRKKYLD